MSEQERYAIDMELVRLREKKRKKRIWGTRILTLSAVWVFCCVIFGISVVQGDSMRPAYHPGDLVIYARLMPGGVDYGDAVILEDASGKECIKRIAGLPGDQIEMDDTGRIYRNGALVPEQDVIYGTVGSGEVMTVTVPEDAYFYLGDNRPVSNDSRQTGCVPENHLRGKILLTFRR